MFKSLTPITFALLACAATFGCASNSNSARNDVNSAVSLLPECESWTDIGCYYAIDRIKQNIKSGADVNKADKKDAESFWCHSSVDVCNINQISGEILDAIDDHTIMVTPLLAAALRHDKEAMNLILENKQANQDFNAITLNDGTTDVFYTIQDVSILMNDFEALKLLVETNADTLSVSEDIHMVAALTSTDIEIAKYIVEKSNTKPTNEDSSINLMPYAVSLGNIPLADWLIARGADVNQIDASTGNTLLHLAVAHQELDMLNNLLDKGADASVKDLTDVTPIDLALEVGDPNIIEVFLSRGLLTPTSVEAGALLLIPNGSFNYYKMLLDIGVEFEQEFFMSMVLDDAFSSAQNIALTDAFIEYYDLLNNTEENAFVTAARSHSPKLVQHLIDKGFDVNRPDATTKTTPLMYAVAEKPEESVSEKEHNPVLGVIKILLKAGAKVDVLDNIEDTPLTLAIMSGQPAHVQALIEAGADVNFRGNYNITALMQAAKSEQPEMVETLLKAGADISIRSSLNETALSLAKQSGNEAIIKLLTDAGATE